jgi:hypothetical protein
MTQKHYLIIIGISGLISWAAFAIVMMKLNPYESTFLALTLFFLSLLIALSCVFTLIGYFFRIWLNKNEIYSSHIGISFRQGLELSLIACGCILFLILGVLNWWSGMLLILAIMVLEFYFAARQTAY